MTPQSSSNNSVIFGIIFSEKLPSDIQRLESVILYQTLRRIVLLTVTLPVLPFSVSPKFFTVPFVPAGAYVDC